MNLDNTSIAERLRALGVDPDLVAKANADLLAWLTSRNLSSLEALATLRIVSHGLQVAERFESRAAADRAYELIRVIDDGHAEVLGLLGQ